MTACVNEFLGRFGDDGIAVIAEPIYQWANGGIFLILYDRGVVERAHQRSPFLEIGEQPPVIDVEVERFRGRVEIGAIDKERNPVGG
jgi:hypothetical protein